MNHKIKRFISQWLIRIVLLITSVILLYPLFWNIMSSFKTNEEFLLNQASLPTSFAWENYVRAVVSANMGAFAFNSIMVVTLSTIILVAFTIPTAYVIARFQFIATRMLETLFMICIFIQAMYIMVPLFVQMHNLGLTNNRVALSVVYAVFQFPFTIFLLAGFIRGISGSFEEAARIDGCSNFRILTRIIVPLAKPGIATATMLAAMGFWNEFPLALVLLRSQELMTIPIGLARLFQVQRRATDFGALFAALVIVLIPTIIIYLIGQKYLLKGISAGGVKE